MPRRITRFDLANSLIRTGDYNSAVIRYRCDKCGQTSRNYKEFTRHKREAHAY